MLFHVGAVFVLVVVCILFGLLRADTNEEPDDHSCDSCEESDSCRYFSIVGSADSQCDRL